MVPLSSAPADTKQTIKWCLLKDEENLIAESFGLVQGAEIQVIASHWGSVVVSIGNIRLALGKEVAERIKV